MDLKRNKNIILYLFTVIFFAVFYYFIPFSGDDWAWGSSLGIERLKNAFEGYNGRYLGNLLIILVTRSAAARVIICSLVMFLLIYIVSRIFDSLTYSRTKTENYIIAFSSVLLLVLPNQIAFGELQPFQIFGSTVGWLSGFTNYVVPSALILVYYFFVTDKKRGKTAVYALLFIDGIAACLCVEHYTLFCLAFSFSVIAYRFLLYRKVCRKSLFFLAGSLIGALIMFTNSSYTKMQKGDVGDNQRAVGVLGSFRNYAYYIFGKDANKGLVTAFAVILLAAIAAFFVFFSVKVFKALKSRSVAGLLPVICAVVMTAPLLVTNSGKEIYIVAPRCYFLQYFMLVIFMYGKLEKKRRAAKKTDAKRFKAGLKASFVCFILITVILHCRLDYYGYVRDDRVNQALKNGASTVEVIEYPKSVEHIQWASNFIMEDTYIKRYARFKQIPDNTEVKILEIK